MVVEPARSTDADYFFVPEVYHGTAYFLFLKSIPTRLFDQGSGAVGAGKQ
jgi:hypothetical protein